VLRPQQCRGRPATQEDAGATPALPAATTRHTASRFQLPTNLIVNKKFIKMFKYNNTQELATLKLHKFRTKASNPE
jgi:hypothetical protein